MRVRKLLKRFFRHVERNRSPATLRTYKGRLAHFERKFGKRKLKSLTREQIERYLNEAGRWPDGREKSPDTRRSNALAFQVLQSYAVEIGALKAPVIEKIVKPRGRIRERIPTRQEHAAILRIAPRAFRLILRALWQSGARPGELARATIEDYRPAAGVIVIEQHKTARATGKPRRIGVGRKMERLVRRAMAARTTGPIFRDEKGEPWTVHKLSRIYKELVRKAGCDDDLCLYAVRHRHATDLCAVAGIHAVAHALGHSWIQTAQRYVHPNDEELRSNQDRV